MKKQNYTQKVLDGMLGAPDKGPGVELGRLCVERDYAVSEVAEYIGVTRMTVYSWFYGYRVPKDENLAKVNALIEKLRAMTATESADNDNQNQLPSERPAA